MDKRKKEILDIIEKNYDYDKIQDNLNKLIEKFELKYQKELEDYIYVDYNDLISQVKYGGYIRYINLNEELKWGGILLKINNLESSDAKLLLMNSNKKIWEIKFSKNYVFYKKHTTYNDKLRELFISYAGIKN